jgi:hypothetical protein
VIAAVRKNKIRFIVSLALLGAFLLRPSSVQAQYDTVAAAIADSLPEYTEPDEGVQELKPDEDAVRVVEEKPVEYDKKYFTDKWEFTDTALQQRSIPADKLKQLKESDDFSYANSPLEKEKKPEVKPGKKSETRYVPVGKKDWFQNLLWIIIIAVFVAAVVWYLASSNVSLFSKKDVPASSAENEELSLEDLFAINYQKELQKAESAGNYRLAIRLMFLRLLKVMSEKSIIRYQQDKTNFDYLLQLHKTRHYDNFFRVTRNYEYSWYGQFDVSEQAYQSVKNDFNRFDSQLG